MAPGSTLAVFTTAPEPLNAWRKQQTEALKTPSLLPAKGSVVVSDDQIREVFEFLEIAGSTDEILERLDRLFAETPVGREGVADVRALVANARAVGVDDQHLRLDLSIARGLDYYTGAVFEVYDPAVGYALGGGGRYDDLCGRFGRALPAAGLALDIQRVHQAQLEEERLG